MMWQIQDRPAGHFSLSWAHSFFMHSQGAFIHGTRLPDSRSSYNPSSIVLLTQWLPCSSPLISSGNDDPRANPHTIVVSRFLSVVVYLPYFCPPFPQRT